MAKIAWSETSLDERAFMSFQIHFTDIDYWFCKQSVKAYACECQKGDPGKWSCRFRFSRPGKAELLSPSLCSRVTDDRHPTVAKKELTAYVRKLGRAISRLWERQSIQDWGRQYWTSLVPNVLKHAPKSPSGHGKLNLSFLSENQIYAMLRYKWENRNEINKDAFKFKISISTFLNVNCPGKPLVCLRKQLNVVALKWSGPG